VSDLISNHDESSLVTRLGGYCPRHHVRALGATGLWHVAEGRSTSGTGHALAVASWPSRHLSGGPPSDRSGATLGLAEVGITKHDHPDA
jgi:hypothetical protein